MSVYEEGKEEDLFHIRRAAVWRRSGFITEEQRAAVEARLDPGLRRTGVFFRILLFVFTVTCLNALFGLVCWSFGFHGRVSAGAAAAGWAVAAFYSLVLDPALSGKAEVVACCLSVAAAGFWLRFRFGFLYGALIALGALAVVPFNFDLGETGIRTALAGLFALTFYLSVRLERPEDGDARRESRDFMQAVSILGVYLSLNVRLPSLGAVIPWVGAVGHYEPQVPALFYWCTYGAVFAIPAGLLAFGWRFRRRVFLDAGLFTLLLSFCTNKDYWGWKHHAWDPAVLGALMAAVAWEASRRSGVTADDVWTPRAHGLELAALGASVLSPAPVSGGASDGFTGGGGGASGGGGAQGNF